MRENTALKMSELNCSWNFIQSHNDKMCPEDEYGTLATSPHNLRKQNHLSQTRKLKDLEEESSVPQVLL